MRKIYCRYLVALLLIGFSFSSSAEIEPLQLKYVVRNIDADITQLTYKVGKEYTSRDEMREILNAEIPALLAKKDLLANEKDEYVVDLEIFVDYRRRFNGDQTPFPSSSIASPNIMISTKILLGDVIIRDERTPELTKLILHFGGANERAIEKDKLHIISAAHSIVKDLMDKRLSDSEKYYQLVKGLSAEELRSKKVYSDKQENSAEPLKGGSGLKDANYIPQTVVDDYIARLLVENPKEKIAAYKNITLAWLNSEKLFDELEKELLQRYIKDDSKAVKELVWAAKALASSGLMKYETTINLVSNEAGSKKLRKKVAKLIPYFHTRTEKAKIVHDASTMSPNEGWEVNQLANMITSDDIKLRKYAVKNVYQRFIGNEFLLNLLAAVAENEAMMVRYRYMDNSDFYAWVCRVLGMSKNIKYKALLEKLSQHAVSEVVKKYANEFKVRL